MKQLTKKKQSNKEQQLKQERQEVLKTLESIKPGILKRREKKYSEPLINLLKYNSIENLTKLRLINKKAAKKEEIKEQKNSIENVKKIRFSNRKGSHILLLIYAFCELGLILGNTDKNPLYRKLKKKLFVVPKAKKRLQRPINRTSTLLKKSSNCY